MVNTIDPYASSRSPSHRVLLHTDAQLQPPETRDITACKNFRERKNDRAESHARATSSPCCMAKVRPLRTLSHSETSATLWFGTEPPASLSNAIVELTTDGQIDDFAIAIESRSLMAGVNPNVVEPAFSADQRVFRWGQSFLDAGSMMRIGLTSSQPLGRVRWRSLRM